HHENKVQAGNYHTETTRQEETDPPPLQPSPSPQPPTLPFSFLDRCHSVAVSVVMS
ncbi:hypothetical protein BaRGS_00017006, partial [Batillaria attramentaria]